MNFDPLEVLSYLENGFLSSPLDRWFTGDSPPSLAPSDVIIRPFNSVGSVVETARSFLRKQLSDERRNVTDDTNKSDMTEDDRRASRGSEMSVVSLMCTWSSRIVDAISWVIAQTEADLQLADTEREAALDKITERNIVLLVEDIVQRCQAIFIPASGAVTRCIESKTSPLVTSLSTATAPVLAEGRRVGICASRERLVFKVGAHVLIEFRQARR